MKEEYGRWYKTFLGIRQRHTYWLYKVIDEILNENPQVRGIIETGTGAGALSIFLGLQCYERNLKPLLTYDTQPFAEKSGPYIYKRPRLFDLLSIRFIVRDCFAEESIEEIKQYADGPIFFYCDNGNKLKEFELFAGIVKKESIIGSHDWESIADHTGLTPNNTKNIVSKYGLIPLHQEEWNSPPDFIKACFWRKENE